MSETNDYTSGEAYDAQYSAHYEPEIRTLTALALRQGGAILDLCCGTGIVTVPLARTGLSVVGVDISEAMLETARAKATGLENLTFILQDALEFDTSERFTLALMTGNAFQCFLTGRDLERLFARVYGLLEPGASLSSTQGYPRGVISPSTTTTRCGASIRTQTGSLRSSGSNRPLTTLNTACCTTR